MRKVKGTDACIIGTVAINIYMVYIYGSVYLYEYKKQPPIVNHLPFFQYKKGFLEEKEYLFMF